ncbi:MAG: hypothetical protein ACRDQC_00300 [Gaiellales bacterium]
MRVRTALVAFAAMMVVGGGTAYADGAPSAGVSQGGSGVVWGALRYVALPAPGGTSVAQIDTASGTVNGFVSLHGLWGIPIVAFDGTTSGVSAGGQTLVLAQASHSLLPSRSRFALVNSVKMRLRRVVTLRGAFYFDAISPDGGTMYLIQHTSAFNTLRYAVRAYDLRTDRLVPGTIVDKREPDERMAGYPVARAVTGDGIWAYTLYRKLDGRLFMHVLDTSRGIAHCVDLPRLAGVVQSTMGLSVDGGRLDIVSGGAFLAAVDRSTFRVTRSPAPAPATGRPSRPADHRPSSGHTAAIVIVVLFGLLVAGGGAALAVRRRRPARGRSGEAAAGAPSGP